MNLDTYRMVQGICSQRPYPILRKQKNPESFKAAEPRVTQSLFEAQKYDKDYAFAYIQSQWFEKQLSIGEELNITAEQLKMICDEVHEMGRLRERKLNTSD